MPCRFHLDDAYALVGDPVNAVTGASLDTRLQFQMPGPIPFQWVHHYDSSKCAQYHSLGWGRAHGYDHRLQFDVDGIRYTAPVGRIVGFPPLVRDGDRHSYGGYVLQRVTSRTYWIHQTGKPSMEFDCPDTSVAPLIRLFRAAQEIRFHYGNGRLQGIVDSHGRHMAASVDEAGQLRALVLEGPDGGRPLLDCVYDTAGNLVEIIDPYRHSSRMRYDSSNREIIRTDRLGYSFHFEYDDAGRCVRTSGEDGLHDTRLQYHPLEGVTLVTRADGGQWTYLCPSGQLERIIDPYGGAIGFKRDASGRIIEEIDSAGNVTTLRYDANGAPAGKVNPLGRFIAAGKTERASQARWMPEREQTGTHQRDTTLPQTPLEWEYGKLYPRLRITADFQSAMLSGTNTQFPAWAFKYFRRVKPAPDGRVYDDFGKLVREERPDGTSRRRVYDANGNLHRLTDADGSVYRYQNASWNLRVANVNPLGHAERFAYTRTEQLASFTDAGGTVSDYEYDLKDRLIRVRRNGAVREEYRYDSSGNLIEKQDGSGKVLCSFEVGPGGLKTSRNAADQKHSFEYDKQGRIVRAATPTSNVEIAYDSAGNRIKDYRNGKGVTHVFSGVGRLAKTTYFGRFEVRYLPGNFGTILIADPRGKQEKIQSFGDGILLRRPSSASPEVAQFDEQGRCLLKALRRRTDSSLWARKYFYSAEGDLLTLEDSAQGTLRYSYDAGHRLNATARPDRTEHFVYDPACNLLAQPGLAASISDGNRLNAANGDRFTYNSRGHIGSRKGVAETRYVYDPLDMLVACELPTGRWEAEYDALSRRTCKIWKERTEFYWDGDRLAAEVREDGTVRLYLYADALALTPLSLLEYGSVDADPASGIGYSVYANHLAAPVLVEDEDGRAVWQASLSAYGVAQIDPRSEIQMALRCPGQYHDAETGLHYNRYRYYSPELGRYLQSDPSGIRGGSNLYAYTANPLKTVDILGLNDCGPDDEEEPNYEPDWLTVIRTGNPSRATMRRDREIPYHNPDEMYLIGPRLPLDVDALDPSQTYLWVVDPDGNILIAPERQPGFGINKLCPAGREVKHGDLTPSEDGQSRGPARSGGELKSINDEDGNPTGNWEMNNNSSYTFMREDGATGDQQNLDASHDLLTQSGTDTSKIVPKNTSGNP